MKLVSRDAVLKLLSDEETARVIIQGDHALRSTIRPSRRAMATPPKLIQRAQDETQFGIRVALLDLIDPLA